MIPLLSQLFGYFTFPVFLLHYDREGEGFDYGLKVGVNLGQNTFGERGVGGQGYQVCGFREGSTKMGIEKKGHFIRGRYHH